MSIIMSYNDFLNEELNVKKALAGIALGTGLLIGGNSVSPLINKNNIEKTIEVNTEIAVHNLLKCNYKYDGYDFDNDNVLSLYFVKTNKIVILNCTPNKKWGKNGNFIDFIIKNSTLKR